MGIDARLESETRDCIRQVQDSRGLMKWLLSFASLESTVCLRFIDPYGNTVFNTLQIRPLQTELQDLRERLTEATLAEGKKDYLRRAASWPQVAIDDAQRYVELLTVDALRHHLEELMALVEDAVDRGPHHYIRFVGD